ncbi:MAG: V-type ATP synthase subunit K, partial [Clostridiales bacterium]|nr:V-type ATP synthase subunit K [Clostridiales bacterium]
DPSKFSQTLILQALPATQGIYGFLIGFLIVLKTGLLTGNMVEIPTLSGFLFLFAGLVMGVVGYFSAIIQARVSASGIGVIAKRPEELVKCVIYAVMVETYAVLALLIGFLINNGIAI